MIGYVRALLGLTGGGLSVAAALSFGMANGAALPVQAQLLLAAVFGMAAPAPQAAPELPPAPVAVPMATPVSRPAAPFFPSSAPAPVAASLAAPQAPPLAKPPGMPTVMYPVGTLRGDQATATRARDGHFYFDTIVNGEPIRMLFDTGATRVAFRAEDAEKVGINANALQYSTSASTANGTARVAHVVIGSMTVGDITLRDVRALVFKPGALSMTLLGQSFMSRLAGYKVDGERLLMQASK